MARDVCQAPHSLDLERQTSTCQVVPKALDAAIEGNALNDTVLLTAAQVPQDPDQALIEIRVSLAILRHLSLGNADNRTDGVACCEQTQNDLFIRVT